MTKPEHAAIYVRISDDRAKDSAGVARQEEDSRALAERLGWAVELVITENDVSAYKRKRVALPNGRHELRVVRPGFRQLLDLIVAGQVDGLIAYDLDRTARDVRDLEDLIDAVEQRTPRLPVESVTGSLRLANDGDVTMARVMVAVANKHSRDSSRRIKRKHDELAQAGKFAGGGARRYGFEADGVTHRPAEVDVLRWAAQEVLSGRSVSSLCRDLNERGVPTVRGGPWSSRALHDMLASPRLAGLRVHRGEVVGSAAWEPIFDRDTHEALVATLHQRKKGVDFQPSLVRWCNQLLICSHCGAGLTGGTGPAGRPFRYWCNTRRGGCGKTAIHGPKVEAELERQILEYLERPDVLAALSDARSSANADDLRREIAEDEQQLRTLSRMWAEKQITLDEYAEARTIIERRIKAARAVQLTIVPARLRDAFSPGQARTVWATLSPQDRRELARIILGIGDYRGWRVMPADPAKARTFDAGRLVLEGGQGEDS